MGYSQGQLALVFGLLVGAASSLDLEGCLRRDSISCVQLELYREVRSFFDQEKIDLFAGLSLVRDEERPSRPEAMARSLDDGVLTARGVEQREEALEGYAVSRVARLLEERKISWNFAPLLDQIGQSARGLADSIPQQLKDQFAKFLSEEGRGKKKKLLRTLLPLLLGLKLKLGAFMVLAYFIIALIAKKALLASLISLAIAGFIAIKKLLSQQHTPHHEVHEVGHHGWAGPSVGGGYSSGGGFGGGVGGGIGGGGGAGWDSGAASFDAHGAYSNNVAHSMAYGGQKPARR